LTGWPWPFNAIQDWLEGLWNWVSEAAVAAVSVVSNWINDAINGLWNTISAGLSWVVSGIKGFIDGLWTSISGGLTWLWQGITGSIDWLWQGIQASFKWVLDGVTGISKFLGEYIGSGIKWLSDNIVSFVGHLGDLLGQGINWLWNSVTGVINTLGTALGGLLNTIVTNVSGFFGWLWDGVVATGNFVYNGLKTAFDGVTTIIGQSISAILGGVAQALGSGLQALIDWLLKSLTWVAQMIIGVVNAVVGAVGGAITSLFSGFINGITAAMGVHSPEPEIAQAVNALVPTAWNRQIEIIQGAYQSEPTPENIRNAALLTVATLMIGGVGGMVLGAAADIAHPSKEIMAHRTVREAIWMLGVPAVTASIITLPTAVGLLTPLRYALNEQFQPMQPGAADIVRFAVRECFEPERLPALLANYPGEAYSKAMRREGFSDSWAAMFWGAHWVLPSIGDLNSYLYRHDDFMPTWEKYMRYHDYIPEGIPWIKEVIYPPYTRVDVRRMWDMRTISEGDLYTNYRWLGYDDKHAKGMVTWTKIYTEYPRLVRRYAQGWITSEQLLSEITALGLPADRAKELMMEITRAESKSRTATERDLTKAEIVKGAKQKVITPEQAVVLLMDLGYEEWEAWFILAINNVVGAGDPEGYWQMKKVTETYKKAQGLPYKEVPDTLIALEAEQRSLKAKIEELKKERGKEVELGDLATKLGDVEYRMRQLIIANKLGQ